MFVIILHFHGGGFLAGSPESHEVYLRPWAIQTNAVIISVDYTLAPEGKYPLPTDECLFVYKWILDGGLPGIKIKNITLVGDSAGGNLVLGVTFKAIESNLRKPDSLILAYPAVNMCKIVSPSRLVFINDVLVPYYFMNICFESYIPKGLDPQTDPICSPVHANDELLQTLRDVNIVIFSAGLDPLLDDSIKLGKRFQENNIKYDHYVFRLLPHGFLNLAQIPTTTIANRVVLEYVKKFTNPKEENET